MRAFLAFEIPGVIKNYLQGTIRAMARKTGNVKWVDEAGQHITVKFFGDIDELTASGVREVVLPLEGQRPVEVMLGRVDAFPGRRRARVIVATLAMGVDNLGRIFDDIEQGLASLGIEKENRDFSPHITLGRRKVPMPLPDTEIVRLEPIPFVLDRLILYRSTLTPRGPVYDPLWEIKLGR